MRHLVRNSNIGIFFRVKNIPMAVEHAGGICESAEHS